MGNLAEKMKTLCDDCTEDPVTCGKNPLDCMKEAELYFSLYDDSKTKKYIGKREVVA